MYFKSTTLKYFYLCFASIFLSACGGGGGGGSSGSAGTDPTTQFPIESAVSAFSQTTYGFTLSATVGADTYTVQLSSTPGSSTTFESQTASTNIKAVTLKKNGVLASSSSGTSYYIVSPNKPLGYLDNGTGHYSVAANQQNLPTNATVGQSGSIDTYIVYTDSTKATQYSTGTVTWSLESDTPTTAWACSNTVEIGGTYPFTESDCYKINTTGTVQGMKITLSIGGQTFYFK